MFINIHTNIGRRAFALRAEWQLDGTEGSRLEDVQTRHVACAHEQSTCNMQLFRCQHVACIHYDRLTKCRCSDVARISCTIDIQHVAVPLFRCTIDIQSATTPRT